LLATPSTRRNILLDFAVSHIGWFVTAAGAVIAAFLSPFGSKVIERSFSRRPAFSLQSSVLNASLVLIVEPANSAAKKRRALSARIRGLNVTNAGKLDTSNSGIRWLVDLSKIERIGEVLQPGNDYEFQFFFSAENPSEKITIRYVDDGLGLAKIIDKAVIRPRIPADFISRSLSNTHVVCEFTDKDCVISRAFPILGPSVSWNNVHDGKEIIFHNLNNTEFTGNKILAEPRYAWVLSFKDCTNLALRELTLGHTEAGYCQGGVLKFENCSNVTLDGCHLFGSGTHGIELQNCQNIEIVNVSVRECTYGAIILTNVSNLAFRNCRFERNLGFDLFEIDQPIEGITLHNCKFDQNVIEGAIFFFVYPSMGNSGFYIHESEFSDNTFAEVSNVPNVIQPEFNKLHNNAVKDTLWASSRRH
jgi:parallel beta-helix repeat protein